MLFLGRQKGALCFPCEGQRGILLFWGGQKGCWVFVEEAKRAVCFSGGGGNFFWVDIVLPLRRQKGVLHFLAGNRRSCASLGAGKRVVLPASTNSPTNSLEPPRSRTKTKMGRRGAGREVARRRRRCTASARRRTRRPAPCCGCAPLRLGPSPSPRRIAVLFWGGKVPTGGGELSKGKSRSYHVQDPLLAQSVECSKKMFFQSHPK